MNAIGPQTHRELVDAWDRFRADDDALVGVLTGAGDKAFCAGGDLKAAQAGELPIDASPDDGVLGPSRWTDIYKPTIAAVNGLAYAGGLEWACWTDLAIADEHATFGVTCRRWNIGLADGGTQRLTRILGLPPRDRTDHHRAGHRRPGGRTHRPRQPGRAERNLPAAGTRAGRHHRRTAPARAAHRPGGRPHRTGPTAGGRPAHRGAMLRPVHLRIRDLSKAYANSTNATTRTVAQTFSIPAPVTPGLAPVDSTFGLPAARRATSTSSSNLTLRSTTPRRRTTRATVCPRDLADTAGPARRRSTGQNRRLNGLSSSEWVRWSSVRSTQIRSNEARMPRTGPDAVELSAALFHRQLVRPRLISSAPPVG